MMGSKPGAIADPQTILQRRTFRTCSEGGYRPFKPVVRLLVRQPTYFCHAQVLKNTRGCTQDGARWDGLVVPGRPGACSGRSRLLLSNLRVVIGCFGVDVFKSAGLLL